MNLKITNLKLLLSGIIALVSGFIVSMPYSCEGCDYQAALDYSVAMFIIGFIVSFLFLYISWSILQNRNKDVEIYFYIIGIIIVLSLCAGLFFGLVYIPEIYFGH